MDIMESSTLMVDGSMLPSSTYKDDENVSIDSPNDENLLLQDLDSYLDDLNACLTVSRMVSDSVIKGMVNAIVQEAAESISSKEAEVAKLNARLQLYESNAVANYKSGPMSMQLRPKCQVQVSCLDCSTGNTRHLHSLKIAAEKHLQMLKSEIEGMRSSNSCEVRNSNYENFGSVKQGDGLDPLTKMDGYIDALGMLLTTVSEHSGDVISSLKDSLYEQQWQRKFEKEVDTFIFQSSLRELPTGFKMTLHKQNGLFDAQNRYWLKKFDELSGLREELESISKSILSIESEHSFTHASHEIFEEWDNTKGKDNFPHRGLGNNPVTDNCHQENNGFASVKKSEVTIPESIDSSLILSLSKEDIINHYKTEMHNVKRQLELSLHKKTEELFRLKREVLKEKGSLQCRKEKDFEVLKKTFLEIIAKLDKALFEADKCSVVQVDHDETCSYKRRIDDLLLENQHLHDLVVEKRKEVKCLSSLVSDAASQMSNYSSTEANLLAKIKKLKWEIEDVKTEAFIRNQMEKCILSELISEFKSQFEDFHMRSEIVEEFYGIILREKTLDLEVENVKKLKQVASLSTLINVKERALTLEVERADKLQQEIMSLLALLEEKSIRLDEALDEIHRHEAKVCEVTHKFMTVSIELEEAHKRRAILHEIIQEKETKILSLTGRLDEQMVQMKSIVTCVQELSKSVAEFQRSIIGNIQRRNSSLETLCHQFDSLAKQVGILKKRELWYREKFEIRSFDLKKAETEVDLLGDEVDALLDILEKIYVALDYYSPVLQHYNGVTEILKLVKRELKGTC